MGRDGFPVVFDGHNDVLVRLGGPDGGGPGAFFERGDGGHLDLPRAREGGFGGGFFAVWVPSPKEQAPEPASGQTPRALPRALDPAYALSLSMAATATLFKIEDRSDGKFRVVRTAAELQRCMDEGVMPAVLHFEGADAIDTDLDMLHVLYRAGLRSLGLVWGRPNAFAEGVAVHFRRSPDTGPGLTEAGRELVRACNDLRIMIDVSHLNERGFWDVAALTDAPLVATHSNAYALCASTRNLTDPQLDAIAASDGMVGLNFAVNFLREDAARDANTPLEVMVRQIDYLVERVGIDRVGFGSDFDGVLIPQEIGDASGLPKLMSALRDRGYDDGALRKLAHENWVRILRTTWGE
ncbi:MAG: Microsomal dipeptidase [uncultured Rubrobacteraceae bacterium]|uniref:Microsomal dipeptidase n=1 Tax=uncultured Rubrobacteraceae bacterium TaxID=349277 RepID=A0A6J4S4W2_9ACTN|nr:MAG: Microsomal dipeptidase [uncultured Rubrobacteraceae bacterium]